MILAIAYRDKNNKDFCDKFPYVYFCDNLEDAKQRKDEMIDEGFKKVTIFYCDNPNDFEEDWDVTWEYVYKRIYSTSKLKED